MSRTTSYAPILAKIGAERSKLLTEDKLKAISGSRNLAEFSAQLRDTVYQEQIAKIVPPLTTRKLERAFNENLIEIFIKIIKNSPKKARKYLELYLLKFEIEHVKTIMKTTSAKLSPEQKQAKIYFSVENYFKKRAVMEEAIKASNVGQAIHAFKDTEYWAALNMGLKNYEENASTANFDVFVDKLFYEKLYESFECLSKKEKSNAFFYASMENDGFTLSTILRGKVLYYEPNWLRIIIPSNYFNITQAMVEAAVSADDFDSTLKIILNSYYNKFFVKTQTPEEAIANAEKAFKKTVYQHAKRSIITEIFNIGAPLAFMTQKEVEVYNLIALSLNATPENKHENVRTELLL